MESWSFTMVGFTNVLSWRRLVTSKWSRRLAISRTRKWLKNEESLMSWIRFELQLYPSYFVDHWKRWCKHPFFDLLLRAIRWPTSLPMSCYEFPFRWFDESSMQTPSLFDPYKQFDTSNFLKERFLTPSPFIFRSFSYSLLRRCEKATVGIQNFSFDKAISKSGKSIR